MKSIKVLLGTLFFLAFISTVACAGEYTVRFGEMEKDDGKYSVVFQTDDIICKKKSTGYRFGFSVDSNRESSFTAKFVLYTPDTVKVYNDDGSLKESTKTIVKELASSGGWVSWNIWFRDCGESVMGDYRAEVFINGQLEREFEFTVRR